MIRRAIAILLFLSSLGSFYLAFTHLDKAGGRGGLLVTGVLLLVFGIFLWRRRR